MALIQRGTWGSSPINSLLGGIFNQDYGLTERLGIGTPNQSVLSGGAALYSTPRASTPSNQVLSATDQQIGPPAPIMTPFNSTTAGSLKNAAQPSGASSNPSGTNLEQNAQGSADAELSTLNSAFDYNKSLLEDQSRDLDSQWNTTDKFYTDQQSRLTGTVDNSKVEAQNTAEENKADALRTAQDVKKQNRMMLRALGVLNSTSATELLAKPMGEYERVRATVAKNLTGRLNELNDFLDSKVSELTFAATQSRQQYESLKGKIATDLRFNERSRADAIKSATAALQERLSEIRLTLQGYTTQVANDQNKIAEYVQTLQSEGLGTVGTEGIANTALSTPTANMSPLTAAIYQPEEKRRLTDVYA